MKNLIKYWLLSIVIICLSYVLYNIVITISTSEGNIVEKFNYLGKNFLSVAISNNIFTTWLIIYLIASTICIVLAFFIKRGDKSRIKNARGEESRFAKTNEIKRTFHEIPEKDSEIDLPGGAAFITSRYNYFWFINNLPNIYIPYFSFKKFQMERKYLVTDAQKTKWRLSLVEQLGLKDKIYVDDGASHSLTIGASRSGKGETMVIPSIDVNSRLKQKPTLIINDPKGELVAASKKILEERGYQVEVLNLMNLDNSMSFNPLKLITDAWLAGDENEAQQACITFTSKMFKTEAGDKNAYFYEMGAKVVNACIFALLEDIGHEEPEKITMYSVVTFLYGLGSTDGRYGNLLELYFSKKPVTSISRMQYAGSKFAGDETRGNIFSAVDQRVGKFLVKRVAKATAVNSLNYIDLAYDDKPYAVFFTIPESDSSMHFLPLVFLDQMHTKLLDYCRVHSKGKLPRNIVEEVDETGNMPAIGNAKNIFTLSASAGFRINLFIQADSQLEDVYGKVVASTIRSNCANQMYVLAVDFATREDFAKQLGKQAFVKKQKRADGTTEKSVEEKYLFSESSLKNLYEEETILLRFLSRKDRYGNNVATHPIKNTGKHKLKSRWRYLAEQFDTNGSVNDIHIETLHKDLNLEDLIYLPKYVPNFVGMPREHIQKMIQDLDLQFQFKGGTGECCAQSVVGFTRETSVVLNFS